MGKTSTIVPSCSTIVPKCQSRTAAEGLFIAEMRRNDQKEREREQGRVSAFISIAQLLLEGGEVGQTVACTLIPWRRGTVVRCGATEPATRICRI